MAKHVLTDAAKWLSKVSSEICKDSRCRGGNHNCESYAYMIVAFDNKEKISGIQILDVCSSDYFTGNSRCNFALPLPFRGGAKALEDEIDRYEVDWYL